MFTLTTGTLRSLLCPFLANGELSNDATTRRKRRKFVYLTLNNSSSLKNARSKHAKEKFRTLYTNVFYFVHFAAVLVFSTTWNNVFQWCGRLEDFKFKNFISSSPCCYQLIPGELENIFRAKQLGIIEHEKCFFYLFSLISKCNSPFYNMNLTYIIIVDFQSFVGIYGSLEYLL